MKHAINLKLVKKKKTSPNKKNNKDEKKPNIFQNIDSDKMQQIIGVGTTTTNGKHSIHCLTIIGEIEGHYCLPKETKSTKYEQIIPALIAIEQSSTIKGLLIVLNTVGGDIEAGLAISELISGINKPTVSIVLGGGHSIGVPLAVSANYSFIVPSASMTIHPVRSSGTFIGVSQVFLHFKKMQDRIVDFVVKNSKISKQQFLKLLMNTSELAADVGSVVEGKKAVEIGLIDSIGSISTAIDKLYDLIENSKKLEKPKK